MSGIQHIKTLAKRFRSATIYFHQDLDGVTSAIAMREYLKQYGILTSSAFAINYGDSEFSIPKPYTNNLGVMVDFSHSKPFIHIHCDHHQSQITNGHSSNQFRHSKSNASTISSIIGNGIFSSLDEIAIDMVDSAGFQEFNISPDDTSISEYKFQNNSALQEHLKLAIACSKLISTYKNTNGWLPNLVLNCKPSLIAIYNKLIEMLAVKVFEESEYHVMPEVMEKNTNNYKTVLKTLSKNAYIYNSIDSLKDGESVYIDNCIIQNGSIHSDDIGAYDRYSPFSIFPNAQYLIMIWNSFGLMQVSINPWSKAKNDCINLYELVLNDLFTNRFSTMFKDTTISLMALKAGFEKKINEKNERFALGFNLDSFNFLFPNVKTFFKNDIQEIEKIMNLKKSNFWNEYMTSFDKEKALEYIKFLNNQRIDLNDIIKTLSGGHKSIVNLAGYNFLNAQQKIDLALGNGWNPFDNVIPKIEISNDFLKTFAKDIITKINAS